MSQTGLDHSGDRHGSGMPNSLLGNRSKNMHLNVQFFIFVHMGKKYDFLKKKMFQMRQKEEIGSAGDGCHDCF